jgi:hypothetical protein
MPLFNRHDSVKTQESDRAPSTAATENSTTQRRSGIFGSRRSPSRTSPVRNGNHAHSVHSVHTNGSTNGSPRPGLLHRIDTEDASITAARERVMNAESAEREADKALLLAKAAVREAMEHVKRLEKEAAEQ